MVAASKLRKARDKAEQATPYADKMASMISALASRISGSDAPKLIAGNGSDNRHLIIAVSADRGLCGGFNSNIAKAVKQKIAVLTQEGKSYKIICIGKKAYEVLKLNFAKDIIYKVEGFSNKGHIEFSFAQKEMQKIAKMFDEDQFDVCTIIFNKFISVIKQETRQRQIIPVLIEEAATQNQDGAAYEFEPNEQKILEELLPQNLAIQFYYSLLESAASEQASRMTAMDNATRNSGEMIKKLSLVYNRTRQAHITKELIEIISGAEAL